MELMNDECCGLLERPFQKNSFRLLLYAVIHAESIDQAMTIMSDFFNILNCGLHSHIQRGETQSTYVITRLSSGAIKSNYALEYFMLVAHRTLCWLVRKSPFCTLSWTTPTPVAAANTANSFTARPSSSARHIAP